MAAKGGFCRAAPARTAKLAGTTRSADARLLLVCNLLMARSPPENTAPLRPLLPRALAAIPHVPFGHNRAIAPSLPCKVRALLGRPRGPLTPIRGMRRVVVRIGPLGPRCADKTRVPQLR